MAAPLPTARVLPRTLDPLLEVFVREVCEDLGQPQKRLASKYLYDAVGSALFDAITLLPEYGLTRADERLLRRCAPVIAQQFAPFSAIVELGSGNGLKTRPILEAICLAQESLDYYPIDGSSAALERCQKELADLPGLRVEGLPLFYLDGLASVVKWRAPEERLLVLFLGSSIGNFDREESAEFLASVRSLLQPGDGLLLGADLEKSVDRLLEAYDDPAGVTAAFNLNVLARINRELGADFDLGAFRHEVRWCPLGRRIEMHLRSLARQSVHIRAAHCSFRFREGETIWTESSHRFTAEGLDQMASRAGFVSTAQWIDEAWAFAESLWIASGEV
jgi:L-histidine N-alpha-methyltransferase